MYSINKYENRKNCLPIILFFLPDSSKRNYSGIPRSNKLYDVYRLTDSEKIVKKSNKEYYKKYLQQSALKYLPLEEPREYEISTSREKCMKITTLKHLKPRKASHYLALSEAELYNIEISPRHWKIDKVLTNSQVNSKIKINNKNDVNIRATLRAHKANFVYFIGGDHITIKAKSLKEISFTCTTSKYGIDRHNIDVIINETYLFETSCTIKVEHQKLTLSHRSFHFNSTGPLYKYLQLTNEYNAPVDFYWDYIGDLKVEPISAFISPGETLTCIISYMVGTCSLNMYELSLFVDEKYCQFVQISIDPFILKRKSIQICDNISLGRIGLLNVESHKEQLRNRTNEYLNFRVENHNLDYLTVEPLNGCIAPFGVQIFTFKVDDSVLGTFKNTVFITVGNRTLKILVNYEIVVPEIKYSCEAIHFKKIAASSFDIRPLTIYNIDKTPAKIEFDLLMHPEFKFSEINVNNYIQDRNSFVIQPGCEKEFLVHVHPFYPLKTQFNFPLILNNIDTWSNRKDNLKMHIFVLSHRLLTKSWTYNFQYFPYFDYEKVQRHLIKFKTIANVKFYIGLKELKKPYKLEYLYGGTVTEINGYLLCDLDADEEICFTVHFEPEIPGIYNINLPVFIREGAHTDMHNILKFKGEYVMPDILFEHDLFCLGYLPLNFESENEINITLVYHHPQCKLNLFCEDGNVKVNYVPVQINAKHIACKFTLRYSSNETHVLQTKIKFTCTCGYRIEIPCFGACENSPFTYYSTLAQMKMLYVLEMGYVTKELLKNTTSIESLIETNNIRAWYKLDGNATLSFPEPDGSDHFKIMQSIVKSVEMYMFHIGFFGTIYHTIPDSMTFCKLISISRQVYDKAKQKRMKTFNVPLKVFLKNICGSKIDKVFYISPYDDQIEQCMALVDLYKQILFFLLTLNAFVNHIQPEFLLSYEHYCIYMKKTHQTPIEYKPFYCRSKKTWLDVILQIINVLIYKRVVPDITDSPNYELSRRRSSASGRSSVSRSTTFISRYSNNNFLSAHDAFLRKWVNKIISEQMEVLKERVFVRLIFEESETISKKNIDNFSTDFRDSIAFCAIIIEACPYLTPCFQGMYFCPNTDEELFHNACLVVKSLEMLNLNYILTPNEICNLTDVPVLLYLSYLYDVFNNIKPKDVITLSANLGDHTKETIAIYNDETASINYNIIFFGNESNIFSLSDTHIKIRPKQEWVLNITYNANFAKVTKAYVVFNGEIKGRRSVRSRTLELIGTPLITTPNHTITIQVPLYRTRECTEKLKCPYKTKATYEIYCTKKRPDNANNLELVPYSEFLMHNMLTRVKFSSHLAKACEKGIIRLHIVSYCIIYSNKESWYIFRNEKVGDFMVHLIFEAMESKEISDIYLTVPNSFKQIECTCRNTKFYNRCPRNIVVHIPSRNDLMWSLVKKCYFKDANEEEKIFWKEHANTALGMNFLKRALKDNIEILSTDVQSMFKRNLCYTVSTDNKKIIGPDNLVIVDTLDIKHSTRMHIHIEQNVDKFSLRMEAAGEEGLEIRKYYVHLLYENKSSD